MTELSVTKECGEFLN